MHPPDMVIVNPPRTGMDERVTADLTRLAPRRVVYISCDPGHPGSRPPADGPSAPRQRTGIRSLSPDLACRDRCRAGAGVKYTVILDGQSVEVEIDGDRVTVAGQVYAASLGAIPGTPLRQLLLDGRPSTLAIESLGRGRWALAPGGERWEVEVLDERARHIQSLAGGADRAPVSPGAQGADAWSGTSGARCARPTGCCWGGAGGARSHEDGKRAQIGGVRSGEDCPGEARRSC